MRPQELTNTILENILTKVSPQIYKTYFEDLSIIELKENLLTISCKNFFIKEVIETRYFQTLNNIVKNVLGKEKIQIELIVKNKVDQNRKVSNSSKTLFEESNFIKKTDNNDLDKRLKDACLNSKYTFSSFVVGSENQLAHAAALAISENPGTAYNPFFIYGGVGLGKTHLIQAIGNEIIRKNSNYKVLYCTTENFLNEMIQSIMHKNALKFREKYRALDVLILDDIQFIAKKEALQEEFFNTFNTLYQSGKQIIVASDKPPADISHLESRIRSRFEGGLVIDIQPPSIETRIAILNNKLKERGEFLPNHIIHKVAEIIDTNIRELEGALLKISIFAKTNNGNISIEDVIKILGNKVVEKKKRITPLEIIQSVTDELKIDIKEIKSAKRNHEISYARQLCMYLLKEMLNLQLTKIAKHVGRKDHTTVIHGISRIEKLITTDINTLQIINNIKANLTSK